MSDALLRLRDVTAFYGPAQALFGVDLEVRAGQVVALMGRNGMGKTTTIRAICRLLPHRSGDIAFMGRDISRLPPHRAARLGLGLCPEGRRCFGNLTVEENLLATARPGPWTIERIAALFPRLAERRGQLARTLSGGEQQMLAVGRALATNPRLLILDEATEGLAPAVRREIWSALAALKAEGQAILIVDKTLREMLRLADACVILEKGVTVWSGPPSTLTPELRDRHLGV
ncbi:ABC transporter ATP-binding protein [Oceanicella actignis]|uniref:ABC transporter ATP-binding protein n=1 Tax=Oceanicella actignis TaxID=1189325 RepID=UPI0011E6695B|nr:ABC transporter ATP-binding protein [Oceanicella actignis]TYO89182.1 branched-chain amino acid transport system ATP-binding protein [Oceanicella actignis]